MAESTVVSVEHLPTAVVVHITARELRKTEVDALCADVDKALVAAPSLPFILDMSEVYFAGSLAIGTLVGLNQEFRTRGQRMIFASFQPAMREVLEVLRLTRVLEIKQDVATALGSVGSVGGET